MTRAPRRVLIRAFGLALVAVVASIAGAHDTWLLPSSLKVPVGKAVTLHLTSGIVFPSDDFAINPGRIKRADARLGGVTRALANRGRTDNATLYRWTPATPGVAALVVELAPKVLTLQPRLIPVYLDEIGATVEVRRAWEAVPSPKQWRESYVKHAATFVRVGDRADSGWVAALGMGFELLPLSDPTGIVAGGSLGLRVLRDGRPLAGQPVTIRRESSEQATVVTTDADGRTTLSFPADGRWLVAATELRRVRRAGLEWESDFATLTLAVAARR